MNFLNTMKDFFIGFFLIITTVVFSQNQSNTIDNQSNTIDNQFDRLLNESSNYKTFKIVQLQSLKELQQNIKDSLETKQSTLDNNNNIVLAKAQVIDSLSNQLAILKTEMDSSLGNNKKIEFLSFQFNQSTFQVVILVIIVILIFLIFAFQYRYKSTVSLIRTNTKQLKEVENELEQFRATSMEREQKLRRQLIDEVNKNKIE